VAPSGASTSGPDGVAVGDGNGVMVGSADGLGAAVAEAWATSVGDVVGVGVGLAHAATRATTIPAISTRMHMRRATARAGGAVS